VDRFVAGLDGLGDVEGFLHRFATRGARRNLLRYRRRAAEFGVTSSVVPITELDLAEVTALCDRSARKHGSDRFYPEGTFEAFLTMIDAVALAVEVRQGGRLLAVGVCLLDEDRLHCWACGVDYRVDGNFSPYQLMFGGSVELALRLGRPVLEGGRGNPEFKLRFGLTPRPLVGCLVKA
jgi:CelD/BcsL family acetyltransferase involved in cellulose biosynthesis